MAEYEYNGYEDINNNDGYIKFKRDLQRRKNPDYYKYHQINTFDMDRIQKIFDEKREIVLDDKNIDAFYKNFNGYEFFVVFSNKKERTVDFLVKYDNPDYMAFKKDENLAQSVIEIAEILISNK